MLPKRGPRGRVPSRSSEESLREACAQKKGVYCSRHRGLWCKSPSGVNGQTLLEVRTDCDCDALLFVVEQRGVFCHAGAYSCFEVERPLLEQRPRPVVIAFPKGRQEPMALRLLAELGVRVYSLAVPGNEPKYLARSHLHPDVRMVAVRAKDAGLLFGAAGPDLVVCYDNKLPAAGTSDPILRWYKPAGIKRVRVVAAAPLGFAHKLAEARKLGRKLQLLSEYPAQTADWLDEPRNNELKSVCVVRTAHGGVEELVDLRMGDLCVVVSETGATLRQFGLEELDCVTTSDLCLAFRTSTYRQYPRLFRQLRGGLDVATIYFYSVDGPHGYLSNFSPHAFEDEAGLVWASSEHYYQAHSKFTDDQGELRELVRLQPTAKECYKAAYKHEAEFRTDRHEVKDGAMLRALHMKFAQHADIRRSLVETHPKRLVEHALKDAHYGCGADGSGANVLGTMLMQLRDKFRGDPLRSSL